MSALFLTALVVHLQAATTKFSDLCTNTSASAEDLPTQTNHVTDTGASPFWAELLDSAGTIVYQAKSNDTCATNTAATSNRVIWVVTPSSALGSADYDFSFVIVTPSAGQTDDDHLCAFGRMTDATHGYGACVDSDTAPQTVSIIVLNGANSGLTAQVPVTTTLNNGDVLMLSMRGDTIKAKINGVTMTCLVDATNTMAGQGGIGQGNFITSTADVASGERDNILLEDATGDGGDDNCSAAGAPKGLLMGILP
jgi:hypothetical protein